MIKHGPKHILFIEPSEAPSLDPVIDELTRKMTAAFRQCKEVNLQFGFHTCACGVMGGTGDYQLPDGRLTNPLCVHYAAFHRESIKLFEWEKIMALEHGEADPTEEELVRPEAPWKPKTRAEVLKVRDEYIAQYCEREGWDKDSLSPDQMAKIRRTAEGKV